MSELITLAEAREYLRIDHAEEDGLISTFIDAALESVGNDTGRQIEMRTHSMTFSPTSLSERDLLLDFAPVASIDTITADGNAITAVLVNADTVPAARVTDTREISVTYSAGYTVDTFPRSLKMAALFMLGHFYENRLAVSPTSMTETPLAVKHLLAPHRLRLFI